MSSLRLDRLVTLSPLSWWLNAGNRFGVPILMYHGVSTVTSDAHPYFETNISPTAFESHLQFLKETGYTTAHLSEVVQEISKGKSSGRVVAITFDDAFRNFYTRAFPLLRAYGLKATLFVPSNLVGKPNSRLGPEPFMTWEELREVSQCGVELGSHSVSHCELYHAPWETVVNEVTQSKLTIEEKTRQAVRSFAYPFAFPETDKQFSRSFIALLEQAGYENGVSTVIGRARARHSQFVLPRLPVNSHDDVALFRAKLNGNYDWLHTPQYAHKELKGLVRSWRSKPA